MKALLLKKLTVGLLLSIIFSPIAFTQTFKISPNGKVSACAGDSIKIEATNGFAMYLWNNGSTNRLLTAKSSGTYICGARDTKGNVYVDSVTITFHSAIKPSIGTNPKNAEICKGDSLVIEAGGKNLKCSWNGTSGSNRFVSYPTTSGYVLLQTTDSNGCSYKTYVQYSVKNCAGGCSGIISAYPDAVLCGNKDSVKIEVKSGYTSYDWSDGSDGRLKTIKKAGWYVVTVKDASGNTCKDSIEVTTGVNVLKVFRYPNDKAICLGDSTKAYIDNNSYDSIIWIDNNKYKNSTYAYFKPTKTSTFRVYAFSKSGCISRGEFTITVKDTCNGCGKLISASKTSLCGSKDSVKLEAKSGFLRYLWSNKKDGRFITVKDKGWYYLAVLKSDSTTCYDSIYIGSGGKEITIKANPTNAVICKGDSIALEATYGFKTYSWSVNGVKHANGIKFKPGESVKVYVAGVDEYGCESNTYLYITVKNCNACPKVLGAYPSRSLCGRDSVHLEAKSGYSNYKWNTGSNDRLIWAKKAGWYWVNFKDSTGQECRDSIYITSGSLKELVVKVNKKPVCIGDTIEITASAGFKAYAWNTGAKTRSFVYVAEKNKEIVVEATDSSGCEARTVYKLIVDSCNKSGMTELQELEIKVYPIPAGNSCHITAGNSLISTVTLYDVYGRNVQQFEHINQVDFDLDLSNLSDGNYVLSVLSSDGSAKRVIIKSGELSR